MTARVWITGAGSGIGAALAQRLAATGNDVVASGRRPQPLAALAASYPGRIRPMPVDVTDRDAVARTVKAMGAVDMAVLCAGDHRPTPAQAFDAETVRHLLEVNLMGTVHCLEALLPAMLERRRGHLVLVASVAGYRGLPTAAGYSASKAAVIALAESLRLDLAGSGVRVTLVNPGFVDTPLTRRNSFAMPDIISPATAADHVLRGLDGNGFEIAFPRRFALAMKLLRILPDRVYFPLMRKVTGC
ncbi:putative metabolite dehydrogenase, NAD-binding [Magnetospirillum gryphiswaldense MSR-1 v2]|uniref:Metabolite dehydrogenase, NAD-binding n=1 Tax=Magnetospirillum gryphiswaldense (strain DSM 6361 / JCM 21280 / NBRC 15271 / MSR-1) TaxID=431944 RepID=V6F661_MAGGM|nr:SDR family NAD(P)-dependent oxidoreductase [Magnetospirillum gryphiswaldense]CDK99993.1 putative metabolite dehydrogenase, NAD-binding [Magnetospirillum gryphiswaldense MSR-1 v2]